MDKKPYGIIYLLKNKINGKCYIGQTVKTIEERIYRHRYKSEKKIMPISFAIKKYGWENFESSIIKTCYSLEELNESEKALVNEYNTWSPYGYNLRAGNGRGSMSEETKRKIGLANKGKLVSDETKKKLSESHKGCIIKESTRKKISDFFKGKKPHINTNIGASLKNSKQYFLINPEGNEIEVFNMKKFCIKNGLDRGKMSELNQGKIKEYKGYKLSKKSLKIKSKQFINRV